MGVIAQPASSGGSLWVHDGTLLINGAAAPTVWTPQSIGLSLPSLVLCRGAVNSGGTTAMALRPKSDAGEWLFTANSYTRAGHQCEPDDTVSDFIAQVTGADNDISYRAEAGTNVTLEHCGSVSLSTVAVAPQSVVPPITWGNPGNILDWSASVPETNALGLISVSQTAGTLYSILRMRPGGDTIDPFTDTTNSGQCGNPVLRSGVLNDFVLMAVRLNSGLAEVICNVASKTFDLDLLGYVPVSLGSVTLLSGAGTDSWVDHDISADIGAGYGLVGLRIERTGGSAAGLFRARPGGVAYNVGVNGNRAGQGVSQMHVQNVAGYGGYLIAEARGGNVGLYSPSTITSVVTVDWFIPA